ncbi:MAG: RibD family protein, partial [Candidatus Marinimicrobia bacterium]|nr:RibD family protein [Candidatus Neomarinimicrobiota bacterium]
LAGTLVYCSSGASEEKENKLAANGAKVYRVSAGDDGRLKLPEILTHLGQSGINSVLVEGGSAIHGSFLSSNLVDEFYIFIAPLIIGEQGTSLVGNSFKSPAQSSVQLHFTETEQLGADTMIHGFVKH